MVIFPGLQTKTYIKKIQELRTILKKCRRIEFSIFLKKIHFSVTILFFIDLWRVPPSSTMQFVVSVSFFLVNNINNYGLRSGWLQAFKADIFVPLWLMKIDASHSYKHIICNEKGCLRTIDCYSFCKFCEKIG